MRLLTLGEHGGAADGAAALAPGVLGHHELAVEVEAAFSSSLKTTSAVMILAMLAGAISSSAFFSNRTAAVSASTRMAFGAIVWKPCARRRLRPGAKQTRD